MRRHKRDKKEFELKLEQEFPFMRQKEITDEQWEKGGYSAYDANGCAVGKGWYDVLRGLCLEITEAYEAANKPVDVVVAQVKEKFGTLRFYCYPEGHNPGIFAFDSISDGSGLRKVPGETDLHKKVSEIVRKWEKKSGNVCEKCGAKAETRRDLGWISTFCDSCYAVAKARYEQRINVIKERKEHPEIGEAERKAKRLERLKRTLTAQGVSGRSNEKVLHIGKDIRYIGEDEKFFDEFPHLEEITVEEGNGVFVSIDGVLFKDWQYEDDGEKYRHLLRYPARKAQIPTSYDIPDGVTSIGEDAFKGCENITDVTIPKTMEDDTFWGAFSDSGIKNITVDADNRSFTSIDGVMFSKYKTELHVYPPRKDATSFDVPEGVRTIWHHAFENARHLEHINIPDSVGFIGNAAFDGCESLTIFAPPDSAAWQYAEENGINTVFEMAICNYFVAKDEEVPNRGLSAILQNDVLKNGRFDMELCLRKFAEHYSEIWSGRDEGFLKREGRLLFLSYLKPLINGHGFYHIESQFTDLRRMDIIVDFGRNQFIVELKLWRGEAGHDEAHEQLLGYMGSKGAREGYLLTFDFSQSENKQPYAKWVEFGDARIFDVVV